MFGCTNANRLDLLGPACFDPRFPLWFHILPLFFLSLCLAILVSSEDMESTQTLGFLYLLFPLRGKLHCTLSHFISFIFNSNLRENAFDHPVYQGISSLSFHYGPLFFFRALTTAQYYLVLFFDIFLSPPLNCQVGDFVCLAYHGITSTSNSFNGWSEELVYNGYKH